MPFDLRITFTGLCMHTWEPQADPPVAHVILPMTDSMRNMDKDAQMTTGPHYACIVYDAGYEESPSSASTRLSFVWPEPGSSLTLAPKTTSPQPVDLVRPWPDNLADLEKFAGQALPTSLLKERSPTKVKFRVQLGVGHASAYEAGGPWQMGGDGGLSLAFRVTWSILGIDLPCLDLALDNAGKSTKVPSLHPIDDGIDLFVYHAPASELPPYGPLPAPPCNKFEATHVQMLYKLFDNPVQKCCPVAPPDIGKNPSPRKSTTATTSTCMGGVASMLPPHAPAKTH